jgi:mono/diheme cytochrome c family protein
MGIGRLERHRLIASIAAVIAVAACARHPAPVPDFTMEPPIAPAAGDRIAPLFTIRVDQIDDVIARLPRQQTTVSDPEYKQSRTYETVHVMALIDAAKPAGVTLAEDYRLIFQASDGYRSVTTVAVVNEFAGRLAIRDLHAADGQSWRPIPGKPSMTPAPSYLVWPSTNADLPWPYAVTTIEVWKTEPADVTLPDDDPGARAGHAVFKKHCASCHSVNGMGGAVGPELNVPANVTEYWNRAALKQFIRNPASIRNKAKMPTLTDLSDADVDAVIAYLVRMKKLKLRVP